MTAQPALAARNVSKVYGATHALRGVDFAVYPGEVTVLFGENGAGKSTLMKILSGVEQPSGGTIKLHGADVSFKNTVEAAERGISIIHQELSLAPNLNVRDNIFMGRERSRFGIVDFGAEQRITNDLLQRLEEEFGSNALVGDLRIGQQQIVEIARALAADARVLIMDEPTSALSGSEVDVLFNVIRELTAADVAIVYISHHLEEALEIGDRAVVLRDGAMVAESLIDDIDLGWVIENMVGRSADDLSIDAFPEPGEPVLELIDVCVPDPQNPSRLAVDRLSLTVRAGEIVCLYGLMGAGRTELLEALAGRHPIVAGTVRLGGVDVTDLPVSERIGMGMPLVPEDRQRDGIVQTATVGENLALSSLLRLVKRGTVSKVREREAVDGMIADVGIKTSGPEAAMNSLSGGNQQKVVIGRVLMTDPRLLLLDEPSRGIDVGAKAEIFSLMSREAERGLGVLYSTSEVSEALSTSSRLIVLAKGHISAELDPSTTDRETVMTASEDFEGAAAAAPHGGES